MLQVLYKAEECLPDLLRSADGWHSLYVNYHKPYVERLWRDWGAYRLFLHRIEACATNDALYHAHPWPSAMRIVEGTYAMGVGYSQTEAVPKTAATVILPAQSAYEMVDPDGWHYVRPLSSVTLSLMVTGKPWLRKGPASTKKLGPLSSQVQDQLLELFRGYYH